MKISYYCPGCREKSILDAIYTAAPRVCGWCGYPIFSKHVKEQKEAVKYISPLAICGNWLLLLLFTFNGWLPLLTDKSWDYIGFIALMVIGVPIWLSLLFQKLDYDVLQKRLSKQLAEAAKDKDEPPRPSASDREAALKVSILNERIARSIKRKRALRRKD